jgi:hypothetical protein
MSKSKGGVHQRPALAEPDNRVNQAKWLASLFSDPASVASQTAAAYSELLDEVVLDVSIMASSA